MYKPWRSAAGKVFVADGQVVNREKLLVDGARAGADLGSPAPKRVITAQPVSLWARGEASGIHVVKKNQIKEFFGPLKIEYFWYSTVPVPDLLACPC